MEGAASAEKRSVEDFRVRVHGGPHPLRAGSEGAATTFGRDDAGWAPRPPDDANASRRIVAHFDVDAFYSQVEELRDPRLRGRPMAVTQKFLIVTANYAARSAGLRKLMSTKKAKALCPEVALVSGEDLTPYRACAKKVRAALERFGTCEKLGLDECWVDLTAEVDRRIAAGGPASDPPLVGHRHSSEHVVESDNAHRPMDIRAVDPERTNASDGVHAPVPPRCEDGADPDANPDVLDPARERRLRVGAAIAAEARDAVRSATGLRMSAGIAHNKMLAKLVSGLHKPDDQTTLPAGVAAKLVSPLPVRALPGVGHGAERTLVHRGVRTAADLRRVTRSEVCECAAELTDPRQVDADPVAEPRQRLHGPGGERGDVLHALRRRSPDGAARIVSVRLCRIVSVRLCRIVRLCRVAPQRGARRRPRAAPEAAPPAVRLERLHRVGVGGVREVDAVDPRRRPLRVTPHVPLLLHQRDPAAAVERGERGGETREAAAHHDRIDGRFTRRFTRG